MWIRKSSIISWIITIILIIVAINLYQKTNFNEYTRSEQNLHISKFERDSKEKYSKSNSYKIVSEKNNDAAFYKKVKVEKNKPYKVTCMVKTADVKSEENISGVGAQISVIGTTEKSVSVTGTTEWQKIEKRPISVNDSQKYILTYFLSEPSRGATNLILKLSEDYKIIDLNNADCGFSINIGPQEFLFLFDHSELILTDSFHGCVFSILYDKPFVVYDRMSQSENMNSRIITLLEKFGMMRKYAGADLKNDIWEHNYEKISIILDKEKIKTMSFLKKAMNLP